MKAAVSMLNLPVLDILLCGLVNKQMKEIIQQSCALQYKFKSYHDSPLVTPL
ncbi:hypothetical protein E1B28_012220 [Marasmius oreades]|uniref:Uncharacterized protein n=1 Tax=Marasmius oreades TaxID=181124 RepID=A0A9P7UNG8_9AGAR|nr:uncharacterized protein E1B28_012220 [Marasmius oreades]KAG7088203.1 hypothetical protein E1B28_012220 [Marasmius oreades]